MSESTRSNDEQSSNHNVLTQPHYLTRPDQNVHDGNFLVNGDVYGDGLSPLRNGDMYRRNNCRGTFLGGGIFLYFGRKITFWGHKSIF